VRRCEPTGSTSRSIRLVDRDDARRDDRPGVRRYLRHLCAVLVVAGALIVAGLMGAVADASRTAAPASGVVASVSDGDTLRLQDGRRIRLVQIDAPELGSGECSSRAARTVLLNPPPVGSRVALEADPALDKVGRYGRILRYVKCTGLNVNLELVRRGAAAPYFYRGERGRYAARPLAAATAARAASAASGARVRARASIPTRP
jgi:endonuclease YncB( thermonuclease family)